MAGFHPALIVVIIAVVKPGGHYRELFFSMLMHWTICVQHTQVLVLV